MPQVHVQIFLHPTDTHTPIHRYQGYWGKAAHWSRNPFKTSQRSKSAFATSCNISNLNTQSGSHFWHHGPCRGSDHVPTIERLWIVPYTETSPHKNTYHNTFYWNRTTTKRQQKSLNFANCLHNERINSQIRTIFPIQLTMYHSSCVVDIPCNVCVRNGWTYVGMAGLAR